MDRVFMCLCFVVGLRPHHAHCADSFKNKRKRKDNECASTKPGESCDVFFLPAQAAKEGQAPPLPNPAPCSNTREGKGKGREGKQEGEGSREGKGEAIKARVPSIKEAPPKAAGRSIHL